MKYTQTILFILILFTSCAKKDIKLKSVLHCNGALISHSLFAWNDKMTNEDCGNSIATQFNRSMNLIYGEGQMSTSHESPNPTYYNSLYSLNNFENDRQFPLKYFLAPKKINISITDSISFDKKLTLSKSDKTIMSTNLKLILYKIHINGNYTWVLSKIIHDDFHANEKGFSSPIFKYNYQIANNNIHSSFTCSINVYDKAMNTNGISIVIRDIKVENDAVLYDDLTAKHSLIQLEGDYKFNYE